MGRTLVTAPSTAPIDRDFLKTNSRIDTADEDTFIDVCIEAATELCETFQGRRYITQTWDFTRDRFEDAMLVPLPPLQSVESIKYIDENGTEQTLSSSRYDVHTGEVPGMVTRAFDEVWPLVRARPNAVTIRAKVGYGDNSSDVPAKTRMAVTMLAADMYERRETNLEAGVKANPTAEALLMSGKVVTIV